MFKLGLFGCASALTIASLALAGPEGGEVVSGQATITATGATQTTITQSSDKVVIDWKSFNIGADESAVFVQPNSNSVALNRIFDSNPSVIAGLLSSNGKLILINRNGMVFDSGAIINTAGLVASTSDIGNDDFMAGRFNFSTPGAANAEISNKGLITAEEGGVVAFVAPSVKNSGVITAKLGRVALGSGDTFVLDLYGDNLISFPVSAEIARQLVDADGNPLTSHVGVSGKIDAGSVQLTARAARGIIDTVINVDGEIVASGIAQMGGSTVLTGASTGAPVYGAAIKIDGGANGVSVGGSLTASGAQGGAISIAGENVHASGTIAANGSSGQGGSVSIAASNFATLTGSISANGASGGSVDVSSAGSLLTAGSISANGTAGAGGTISLTAANRQIATTATQVSANGASGGGSILVAGGQGLFTSGGYTATSSAGNGGGVSFGGADIKLIDTKVDASGMTGGGHIAIGFTGSGADRAINADNILVSPTSTFNADATGAGHGGSVVFWSNLATEFMGTITAKGGSLSGDGGFLEVSSKGEIGFWGLGDASAANGVAGLLSLDPKNLIVSTTGAVLPSYELIDAGSGDNSFGGNIAVLANGNTVVTSTGDDTAAGNAGAVFVYNTTTGALVSMVTGSRSNDNVGSGGITVLSSGNFVVASSNWDNGAGAIDAGAVTFGNGTTGVSGVVSAANSLVGLAGNMNVGSGGVRALSNGNYVVASPNWDNGATTNVGAVTWGNGAAGTVGGVSTANSLHGSTADDLVGNGGVVALTNGNYVVASINWDANGAAANDDHGAVTWRNGAAAAAGAVSAANSLVGSSDNDNVGSGGVTALTNGNFAVASPNWNNGGTTNAGAATWGNGTTGAFGPTSLFGAITAVNSYIGGGADDDVGSGGIVALSNGNYVIVSPDWDGAGNDRGAVTWGNGATGTAGTVGTLNSLFGSTDNDLVGNGGVVALTNGNYVVASINWDANGGGANDDHGAVTWRSGLAGAGVAVSAANSLVGSSDNDNVGSGGITALTNGNFAVASPDWNNGGTTNAGAATWGSGTTGAFGPTSLFGAITAVNSYIGGGADDDVGSGGIVALSNGNYVIVSPEWDGAGNDRGAVTWGNGATGTAGTVGIANSLFGSTDDDLVGNGGVFALANGNYVVASINWDANGGAANDNHGAVTWRSGLGGPGVAVSAANSLIGTADNDAVGSGGILGLADGRYVVSSPVWNNGVTVDTGAVTVANAAGDTVGTVSTANSLAGASGAQLNAARVTSTNEILARSTTQGTVLAGLTDPNQLTFARAQGQTLTVNPAFLTRTLNTGTAVSLQASNDLTIANDIIVNNPTGNGGALTLQAGRSVLINADITTDNGNLTIVANELLANGVINAQRDAGAAVLSMGVGADINAGTGAVRLTIASGAGKSQTASGDMTLRNVAGGSIIAENLGPSSGNVVLASGALSASGADTPLVVASQGGNFINNAGAGALSAPGGRWIVYSQNPAANTLGGLAGSPYYNTPYNAANPTGLSATGNRFAYTLAPVLTVTPNNASREYGEANPAFTYGVTGLVGGDTLAAAVAGAPSISSLANATSSVAGGPYAITATLGTLASDYNYGFSFAPGQLAITPATLTYVANSTSRLYGDANPAFSGTVTGFKNGELVGTATTGTLTFTSPALATDNVGSYAINGSGLTANNGNYVFVQALGNASALSINQATLTYVANSATRLYGDANPALSGTVTGFKNGQSVATATTGSLTFTSPALVTDNVGTYAINGSGLVANNGNYIFAQAAANATALTIDPATLFYTANAASRLYGDANPALSGTVTGFRNGQTMATATTGTLAFGSTADANSNVGSYAITGSGLASNSGNYVFAQHASNATALTINPAQLFYTANTASREYGDPNGVLTGALTGMRNGQTAGDVASGTLVFTSTANETVDVGTYAIAGSGLTVTSSNYVTTILQDPSNATALSVTPAQLYYLADQETKLYGDSDINSDGEVIGLKNGDGLGDVTTGDLEFTTSVTANTPVGQYGIFGSGLTVTSGNYAVTILQDPSNATAYTITQAQLFYVADNTDREYGDPNDPFTGDIDGLIDGDTLESVVSGTLVFTTSATQSSNVGLYAVNGSGLTVINPNYALTILQDLGNETALEITPAQLFYVADPSSRVYGDANPLFTGTVEGMKNGDTLDAVTDGVLTFLTAATPLSNVGDYDIFGAGLTVTSGNYELVIEQDTGTLEIVPATLFYAANAMSSIYGDDIGPASGTIIGLKNGESLASTVVGTLVWTVDADSTDDVGVYGIEGSGMAAFNPNYESEIQQAASNEFAMIINPAQLSYLADPKSRIEGLADPVFTGQLIGLKNGDDATDATIGTLVFNTTATTSSPGGNYAINGGGLTVVSGNYLAAIPQDPSNATALTIIGIPFTTQQTHQEGEFEVGSALEAAEGTTSSRSNELNIVGTGLVSDDMSDGKNDEMAGQLCILGAPEASATADCHSNKSAGN